MDIVVLGNVYSHSLSGVRQPPLITPTTPPFTALCIVNSHFKGGDFDGNLKEPLWCRAQRLQTLVSLLQRAGADPVAAPSPLAHFLTRTVPARSRTSGMTLRFATCSSRIIEAEAQIDGRRRLELLDLGGRADSADK
jgi:hypothetical protein